MLRSAALAALVALALPSPTRAGDDWPAFRGGSRAGVAEAPTLPAAWDATKNVLWKVEIPGAGWSSPVVWGDRVFVTSAVTDGKAMEPLKGLYLQDLSGKAPPGEYRWLVHCLDRNTGKTLWKHEAFKGAPAKLHGKNSPASETPVVDGERVYAYFGNVGLVCCDHDGKELWTKKWPAVKTRMGWGTGASPALDDGRLYVVNDNEERSFLSCLDGRTGKQLWEVERIEKSNWTTPYVWKNEQRTEVVTAGTGKVRSYDTDGKLLWDLRGMSVLAIPSPFAANGLLYVASGHVADPFLKPVYAIRPGAAGDISLAAKQTSSKWVAWCQPQAGPYHPTPLAYGDFLYVLYDRGFLSCYDARSGEVVYEKQRLGPTAFTASPWACGGKIFCLSEDGETVVVKAGREFKVLGKNRLDDMALATPALAGGSLFLRTQSRLYCLRQAPAPGEK